MRDMLAEGRGCNTLQFRVSAIADAYDIAGRGIGTGSKKNRPYCFYLNKTLSLISDTELQPVSIMADFKPAARFST